MAGTTTSIIDWEAVGRTTDLGEIVRLLPPERIIAILGPEKAIEVIRKERGLSAELADVPTEQLEDIIRQRKQAGESSP